MSEYFKAIADRIQNFFSGIYKSLSRAEQERILNNEKDNAGVIYRSAKFHSLEGNIPDTSGKLKYLEDFIEKSETKNSLKELYPAKKIDSCYLRSVFWNNIKASTKLMEHPAFQPENLDAIAQRVCEEYSQRGQRLDQEIFKRFAYRYAMRNALKFMKSVTDSGGITPQTINALEGICYVAKKLLPLCKYSAEKNDLVSKEIDNQWKDSYQNRILQLEQSVLGGDVHLLPVLERVVGLANKSLQMRGIRQRYAIGIELYIKAGELEKKRRADNLYLVLDKVDPRNNGNGIARKKDLARLFTRIKREARALNLGREAYAQLEGRIGEIKGSVKEYLSRAKQKTKLGESEKSIRANNIFTVLNRIDPKYSNNGAPERRVIVKLQKQAKRLAYEWELDPEIIANIEERIREIKESSGYWSKEKQKGWGCREFVRKMQKRCPDKRVFDARARRK